MASVTGMTVERLLAELEPNVIDGYVDGNGQLILIKRDGSEHNAGPIAQTSSPQFTGNPTAPTPATSDNDFSIATTAFVKNQQYAPLLNPVFSGNPQAPTPTATDNDNTVATTKFVKDQLYLTVDAAKAAYKREGTSAERDSVFGVPASQADRLTLANKRPTWFNTEKGWDEIYLESDTLTATGVKGLLDGVEPGWYPATDGPWAMVSGTSLVIGTNKTYDRLVEFGVTAEGIVSARRGGADYFTRTATDLTIKRAGMYDLDAMAYYPNGAGVFVGGLILLATNSAELAETQKATSLLSSYGTIAEFKISRRYVPAGARLRFHNYTGSGNIRVMDMSARYVGPAFAYDN